MAMRKDFNKFKNNLIPYKIQSQLFKVLKITIYVLNGAQGQSFSSQK